MAFGILHCWFGYRLKVLLEQEPGVLLMVEGERFLHGVWNNE